MNFSHLLILSIIAGGTIYIGLLIGRIQNTSNRLKSALNMLATGILIYLFIEILSNATGQVSVALQGAKAATQPIDSAILLIIILIIGLSIGLIGLVQIENCLIRKGSQKGPKSLSLMIAIGIGFHNFSEGLAIGQSYAGGQAALAIGLIIGFALHNATEGFGIVSPLMNKGIKVSWKSILFLGAIGGGPTFVGALIGSVWTSATVSVLFLSIAGGSLLYIIKELLANGRKEMAQVFIMSALILGFVLGWGTETITSLAQSPSQSSADQGAIREADGDVISSRTAKQSTLLISHKEEIKQQKEAQDLTNEKALNPTILSDGTKQFTLTASAFNWEVFPGTTIKAWGYNDQVPGPIIRVKVGDKVTIKVMNKLPQETTLHLHGLAVPNDMDGVPAMKDGMGMDMGTQKPIPIGGSFTYKFTVTPQMVGTHYYHSHVNDDFQVDQGLHGILIVDPKEPEKVKYDVDSVFELASWKINGSDSENVFTINGKAFPEAPSLTVKKGQRVRIRLINASAEESHVMHLHGYTFQIIAKDGNPLVSPESANTIDLGPSQTADISFIANNPGEWMFHCHILDHTINPGPNGDGSSDKMADMGGLATFINVK